jgi:hypothetical protein
MLQWVCPVPSRSLFTNDHNVISDCRSVFTLLHSNKKRRMYGVFITFPPSDCLRIPRFFRKITVFFIGLLRCHSETYIVFSSASALRCHTETDIVAFFSSYLLEDYSDQLKPLLCLRLGSTKAETK